MNFKSKEGCMRCHLIMLFVALFTGIPIFAQTQPPAKTDQAAIVAFAQKAAVRALDFVKVTSGA
jgi:hypothetical protein